MNCKRGWAQVTRRVESQRGDGPNAIGVHGGRPVPSQETLAQDSTRTPVLDAELHHQQLCFVGKQELPEEPLNVDAVVPNVLSLPIGQTRQGTALGAVTALHVALTQIDKSR